jgi:hypothetical protein
LLELDRRRDWRRYTLSEPAMRRVEGRIQHVVRRHAAEWNLRAPARDALVLDTGTIP